MLENSLLGRFHETFWEVLRRDGAEEITNYLGSSGSQKEAYFQALRDLGEEKLELQHKHEREVLETRGLSKEDANDDSEKDSGGPGPRRLPLAFSVELKKRERLRAAVLLEIRMRGAAEHPDVKDFRDRGLGGRLLSADEAEAYFRPHPRQSIADEALADLAQRLEKYYGWHRDDAAWFVLTGDPPTFRPLAASFRNRNSIYGPSYGEITLHVAPWIPAAEVKQAYLQAQNMVRGGEARGVVSEQRLMVLRFVEKERAKREQQTPLKALFELWNQKHPRWAYADYTAFSKAYRVARSEVLYPAYFFPLREPTPNIERLKARASKQSAAVREILKQRNQGQ